MKKKISVFVQICLLVTPICYVLISYYDVDDEKCCTNVSICLPRWFVLASMYLCVARANIKKRKREKFVIIDKQLWQRRVASSYGGRTYQLTIFLLFQLLLLVSRLDECSILWLSRSNVTFIGFWFFFSCSPLKCWTFSFDWHMFQPVDQRHRCIMTFGMIHNGIKP